MVHTYNEIVFNHKKEWSVNIYYNSDKPKKIGGRNKMKCHILHDSVCVKYLK